MFPLCECLKYLRWPRKHFCVRSRNCFFFSSNINRARIDRVACSTDINRHRKKFKLWSLSEWKVFSTEWIFRRISLTLSLAYAKRSTTKTTATNSPRIRNNENKPSRSQLCRKCSKLHRPATRSLEATRSKLDRDPSNPSTLGALALCVSRENAA